MSELLITMLTYRRPEGSKAQKQFCDRFLKPVFGEPDLDGNYLLQIGESRTIFTAHHDTVHNQSGRQSITVSDEGIITSKHDCLGADCTTGVWLILEMIAAGVPGLYVVHAAEECGGIGSTHFVQDNKKWLAKDYDACISFDRYGQSSIITHQCGRRTASTAFAKSLAKVLDMPELQPDDGGVFTDSDNYADDVPECTNISVGYMHQHTRREYQDLGFAMYLRDQLIDADWSQLVISRDPSVMDWGGDYWGNSRSGVEGLVRLYPHRVAEMLEGYGFDEYDLANSLGLEEDPMTISKLFAS